MRLYVADKPTTLRDMSTPEIAAAVRSLPTEEKIELLELIAADLVLNAPPAIKAAQLDEVLRRRQAWVEGKTALIPGERVMQEMRARSTRV